MEDKKKLYSAIERKMTIGPVRLGQLIRLGQLGEILKENITIRIINIYEHRTDKAKDKAATITKIAEIEIFKVGPTIIDTIGEIFVDVSRFKETIDFKEIQEGDILTIRPAKSPEGITSIYMGNLYPD